MKALLDTHSLLWLLEGSPKLTATAADQIQSAEEVCVSVSSLIELSIKKSLGRIELPYGLSELWKTIETANRTSLLPISNQALERLSTLPYHHRDPFDRLIVCEALTHDLVVVSADIILDRYGVVRVW